MRAVVADAAVFSNAPSHTRLATIDVPGHTAHGMAEWNATKYAPNAAAMHGRVLLFVLE
jgi:hypothetical protein